MIRHDFDIAEFPIPLLIKIVANLLDSILTANDSIPITHITPFHSRAVPKISMEAYLSRISKFAPFNTEVLLSIFIYFDRIAKLQGNSFVISSLNIHRLLIASVLVSSKMTSDTFYSNTRYAKVGGIPLYELNQLELEFLFLCNFDLHIPVEAMQEYGSQLLAYASVQPSLAKELAAFDYHVSHSTASSSHIHPTLASEDKQDLVPHSLQRVTFPLTPPYPCTPSNPYENASHPGDRHTNAKHPIHDKHREHRQIIQHRTHPYYNRPRPSQ